jgi:EmrB/QacA subfamily drug resistance transporter
MAEDTTPATPPPLPAGEGATPKPQPKHGVQFWGIFVALCILAFISALDVSIISTALPTITAEIGGGSHYIWIANSFIIASSVLQPLFGQLANIFGRRTPLIISILIFALGSGIGGGANNVAMLIAGRTVQGVGAGGIYVLIDIVCCDLVPLRERGKYLGMMFSWAGVAAALGPPVGGAIAEADWRWVFWINLPICGIALVMLLVFMKVQKGSTGPEPTTTMLKQVDYIGALLFIPSLFAVLFGLIMGGVTYPWSSWRIIVPLVLGIVGWSVFHLQQHFLAKNPSVPSRLFANRTSVTGFALTFLSSILVQSLTYFLPIYFQGARNTTVLDSGTFFLPFAIGSLFSAVLGGALLSKFGAYRPLHAGAFAVSAIAFGLFTLLDADSLRVEWAFYQLIAAAGTGITMSTMLPAIMAGLPESDVALSSATYSFIRNFGLIWGVTIPGIIFSSATDMSLHRVSDGGLRDELRGGAAYAFASQAHILQHEYDEQTWGQVNDVYVRALRAIWWFGLGISIVSFFAVAGERGLELRTELDTEYGIDGEQPREKVSEKTATSGDQEQVR